MPIFLTIFLEIDNQGQRPTDILYFGEISPINSDFSIQWGKLGLVTQRPLTKISPINTPYRSHFQLPLPPFLLFLYSATLASCQPPLGSLQWLTKESSWAWATPSSTFLLSSTKNSFKGNSTLLCSAVRRPLLFKCCVLFLFLFLDPFLWLSFRSDWLGVCVW